MNWGVATTGAYLKVFRLNAQGCASDTTTLPVIINQRLQTVRPTGPGDVVAVAPLPRAICQADGPYTYTSGVFANGSSYSWAIVGGTQLSSVRNTVTVNWNPVTVPTIGKIVVTETGNPAGNLCRDRSDTLRVLINPSPRSGLALVSPGRVCQTTGPVTVALPGGLAGSSYVFALNGTPLAGTGSTRTLSPLPAPGTYVLTAQETSAAGCAGPRYTTPFTVSPTPAVPTIAGAAAICNPATAQQYAIANPTPGATFQWTITGGAVTAGGSSSQVTVRFNPTGPYAVSALESSPSPAACPTPAATRLVALRPAVNVGAGPDKDIAEGEQVVLEGRADGNYPVVWTPTQGLTFGSDRLRPLAAPTATTVYTLSAGAGDCANASQVTVTVRPAIRIPNAFSPNGDGRDDTWEIDRIGTFAGNTVAVFNRWGNQVFQTTNYGRANEWRGDINGQPAPVGTYYYVIVLAPGKAFSGSLTVVY